MDVRIVSAAGDRDHTPIVWEAESGVPIARLAGHSSHISTCAYSPDGRRIVSASWDNTLRLWDAGTFEAIATLAGHSSSIEACEFLPDGRWIVSASDDKTLKVWDAETAQTVATLMGHSITVGVCAFSPDGRRIVSGTTGYSVPVSEVPRDTRSEVRVWDARTGAATAVLPTHTNPITACGFSPDGRWIVSASADKTVKLWHAATGAEVATLAVKTPIRPRSHQGAGADCDCAFSPDGRFIIFSAGEKISVWDVDTRREVASFIGVPFSCVVPGPDGRLTAGGFLGSVTFLRFVGLECQPARITAVRIWRFGAQLEPRRWRKPFAERRRRGIWDSAITAVCAPCGVRFPTPQEVLDVIRSMAGKDRLSSCPHGETLDDPGLLSECPRCHMLVRFNPFIVDNATPEIKGVSL